MALLLVRRIQLLLTLSWLISSPTIFGPGGIQYPPSRPSSTMTSEGCSSSGSTNSIKKKQVTASAERKRRQRERDPAGHTARWHRCCTQKERDPEGHAVRLRDRRAKRQATAATSSASAAKKQGIVVEDASDDEQEDAVRPVDDDAIIMLGYMTCGTRSCAQVGRKHSARSSSLTTWYTYSMMLLCS